MSSQTRAAVLDSLKYKPTDFSFEYVFVFFSVYAIFTRSIATLLQEWFPFFAGLMALYFVASVIFRVFDRKIPDVWDVLYWFGLTTVFSSSVTLYVYGAYAFFHDIWLWFTTSFSPFASRPQFIVVTGLMTIGAGVLFFLFRLRRRFLYGLTEACVGVLVGMHRVTMEEWPGASKSTGFYLALLTAGIYLVVRGLDNMYQALRDGDPMGRRFVNFVLRRQEPKPIAVLRIRAHRDRYREVRKTAKPVKPDLFDRLLRASGWG